MPTFEEAERKLLKEYNEYKKIAALKKADVLPMDAVIHKCSQNNYPKKYLQQFMDKHFTKGEKEFYSLVEKGIIIRSDDSKSSTPTTVYSYKLDSNKFTSYAISELSKNTGYLYSPATSRNFYEDLENLVYGIFSNCDAVMNYDLTTGLTNKTHAIHNEILKEDNVVALRKGVYGQIDSQTEMEKLNTLISTANENGKQTDRNYNAKNSKELMKQLDYAMIGHKKRGFWSMVFHPVTYYREYKAIETAKTTLAETYNLGKDFVDKYTKYLNDLIETDLEFGKTKRLVNVEINVGDKIEQKVKGFSAYFHDRLDCLDKANEKITVSMNNLEGLIGEKTWGKLPDSEKRLLENNWEELTKKLLGDGEKGKELNGTVMDKLVEKYYGLTPDHQTEEEYEHKKLVIIDGLLRDNGYDGVPYLPISNDERIVGLSESNSNSSNSLDDSDDDIEYDEKAKPYQSIDYNNFSRTDTSVTEAIKLISDVVNVDNLINEEPDLEEMEDIENDTLLAEQKKVDISKESNVKNKEPDLEEVL